VQTERVVAKDNTVARGDQHWQLEKSRFRTSLAGCTVTIHQHLDATVSIRYGPHVVGRFTADARPAKPESRGKGGPVETAENQTQVSHRSHRSGDSCFPIKDQNKKTPVGKPPRNSSGNGLTGQITWESNRTD
jgi:hypothetical protein